MKYRLILIKKIHIKCKRKLRIYSIYLSTVYAIPYTEYAPVIINCYVVVNLSNVNYFMCFKGHYIIYINNIFEISRKC